MRRRDEPLLTSEAIQVRVAELAQEIDTTFQEQELTLVVVLKGGFIFAADLIRQLTAPVTVEFIRAESYQGTASSGSVNLHAAPCLPIAGQCVLVVEDILDTGHTTAAILNHLRQLHPAQVALCVLLDKPARRTVSVTADFVGFTIDSHFVVGYGLDYNQRYRNLPGVYVLEEDSS
jgi:hypoxanthine phosphoribosyltransferase